jgi:hypothetical protein
LDVVRSVYVVEEGREGGRKGGRRREEKGGGDEGFLGMERERKSWADAGMKNVRTSTAVRTVRTMLTHEIPYPHEHSRHALLAVVAISFFFISTDNLHIVLHKLDKNIKWWSIYAFLLGFFYFFSSPFLGKTIQPSYSNFSRWFAILPLS